MWLCCPNALGLGAALFFDDRALDYWNCWRRVPCRRHRCSSRQLSCQGKHGFFELLMIGLDLVSSVQAASSSELTNSFISYTGRPRVSSTTVASGAIDNFSFFLPLGQPRCEQSGQAWYHVGGMLDGWQGSVRACGVREDVRILLALWYVAIHLDAGCLSLMAT